jgi:hypothetical protein
MEPDVPAPAGSGWKMPGRSATPTSSSSAGQSAASRWPPCRFVSCRRIAVGVSVISPADHEATGFDLVLARDGSPAPPLPDLSEAVPPSAGRPVPVAGIVLATGQGEYGERRRHEVVAGRVTEWLGSKVCACGCRNLCHQATFVDDATRAVMPPDPEMIQVGDAIWQRPQWRCLVQSAVRPVLWGPAGAGLLDSRVSAAQRLMLRR